MPVVSSCRAVLRVHRACCRGPVATVFSVFLLLLVASVAAQQAKPTFEVASIRPAPVEFTAEDLATVGTRVLPGGVFRARHVSVQTLLTFAYDLKAFQITGGPDWRRMSDSASTLERPLMRRSIR